MITGLTVREHEGQNDSKSRFQAGASHAKNVAGGGSPYRSGQEPHVSSAAFSRLGARVTGGRAGGSRKARRCSIGLPTSVSVAHPFGSGLAVQNRDWSINMAINATTTGAIRLKNTQARIHADSTTDTITWVREASVIKRIRRKLAERNHHLVITRLGTQARVKLGEYAVLNDQGEVLDKDCNLADLARFIGVLAADEMIDQPLNRGWRYYIGRTERVMVDGISANYARPITRTYTPEAAARRAVAHLADREGLVVCFFDASIREVT